MSEPVQAIGSAPTLSKVDPESLVLRGAPRAIIRFRKGLIVGVIGAASFALIALAWVSLKPSSFHLAARNEMDEGTGRTSTEVLAGAPKTYSDIPRLGPPLPGDLGRAIVDRQRQLAEADGGEPGGAGQALNLKGAAAEREHFASEQQAARSSAVLVNLATSSSAQRLVEPSQPEAPATVRIAADTESSASEDALGPQQEKLDFIRSESRNVSAEPVAPGVSPWTLVAGTVVPASLITGLNSDLPGIVVAQVTENVRDSATGRTILIPQGARLIGKYDSAVAFGQRRALLVWQRVLFPDGSSVTLDNMPASDTAGYAGLEDKVDFHEWRLLKGIALSSLLGIGSEFSAGGNGSDLVRALRDSAQANGSRAGDQIVARDLDVRPTLKARPGWPVRAIVNKDLILKPWRG